MPGETVRALHSKGYVGLQKPATKGRMVFVHPDLLKGKKQISAKQELRGIPNHVFCLVPGEEKQITFLGQEAILQSPADLVSVLIPWYNQKKNN
ncbi:MAG: hypothetical protein WC460_04810 [Patescibacteria group bacterium]